MIVKLTSDQGYHECRLSYARVHYLERTPTWQIKAALIQQKKPVINGWRIEEIKNGRGRTA